MTARSSSGFSDLDILLVDSDKFNQLFIQKIKSSWIDQNLSRITRSPKHFQKLFLILVNFVVDANHPIWAHRALKWLKKIFANGALVEMVKECPETMCKFTSYYNKVLGLHCLIDTTLREINSTIECKMSSVRLTQIEMLDTGYVFIDDPELNFGAFTKRSLKQEDDDSESVDEESVDFEQISIPSGEDLDDGSDIDMPEEGPGTSEDDGVFDMDKGSLSSVADSHGSMTAAAATRPLNLSQQKSSDDEDEEKEEAVIEDVDVYMEEYATDDEVNDGTPVASGSEGEVETADTNHCKNASDKNGDGEEVTEGDDDYSCSNKVSILKDGRVAVQKRSRKQA